VNSLIGSISQAGDLCHDGTIYLTTGSGGYGSWSTGHYAVTIPVYEPGDYSVEYDDDGCNKTATISVVREGSNCIIARKRQDPPAQSELEQPESFSVFPNPANNELTISLLERVEEETPINFTDMLGRTFAIGKVEKGSFESTVQTSDLNEGIYLISIKAGKLNYLKKVVIKR
jgi:hypothetical protein